MHREKWRQETMQLHEEQQLQQDLNGVRLPSSSSAQGPSILPKFEAFKTPTVVDTYDFVYLIPLPLLGETTSPPYTSSNVITLLFYPQ